MSDDQTTQDRPEGFRRVTPLLRKARRLGHDVNTDYIISSPLLSGSYQRRRPHPEADRDRLVERRPVA